VSAQHARATTLAIPERPARDHGRPPPPAPDRARLELLELRFSLQREARERAQALQAEQRELERSLRTQLDALARRSSDTPIAHRVRKAIEIELTEVTSAGAVQLLYRVRSARWAPSYRLSFDSRTQRARLAMRAAIAQRTGEDWRGAGLSVSTARMDGWYDLPELASLRIGRAQPPPRTGYRPLPADGVALFADHDRAFSTPAAPSPQLVGMALSRAVDLDAATMGPPGMPPPPPSPPMGPPLGGAPPIQGFGPPGNAPMGAPVTRSAPMAKAAPPAPSAPQRLAAASMAMPAAAAPQAARAKGGGLMANLLGGFGGGGGAPMAEGAAYESAAYERAEEAFDDSGADAGYQAATSSPTLSRALLDFGRLRLDPPSAGRHGALHPLSLEQLGREAGRDLRGMNEALGHARAMESAIDVLSAPPLHSYPDSLYGFDHRYDATTTVEVPSDGAFHSVAIIEAEGPAAMLHVSVPREDPAVFRTLSFTSPLEGAVLRGPVDVYLDGSLLVSSSVDPSPTGGKLEIGMGVDESVKVARNVRFREESAGLMGGSSHLVHELEIDVRNAGGAAIRLEVRERLPVTAKGEEDIEVRAGKTSPPWHDTPPDDPSLEGGKRWVLDIRAGAEVKLSTEYTIRIASKNELVGGNRRD
ncbi:MAG: DUF4139 domain-containing protein, partial [Deltaproteobacteria bacterium]|nr:DUF4139 domain-containing protein [Deltaproteobacteria bacterium]